MIEFRCKSCNKLLFKGKYLGTIQIMCNRCKKINEIECQKVEEKEHQPEQ